VGLHNRKSLAPWIHDDIDFRQHQVEGVRRLMRMKSAIIADEMGLGKMSPLSEPVLTVSGWRTMGDLKVGDFVVGPAGEPTEVLGVYPQGVRENVRVTFSDGSWTLCGWEHLWEVNTPLRKWRGSAPLVLTTREIVNRGLKHANGNRKWFIPMVGPVAFQPTRQPELDPYLMGVLLGDGSFTESAWGASLTTDVEIVDSLCFPQFSTANRGEIRPTDPDYLWRGNLTKMRKHLEAAGLERSRAEGKSVPEHYLWGSVETRVALLQGLLDTDGTTVSSRGGASTSIEYGTVSKQLSEDVRFLVQSLGGTASIAEKLPTYTYDGERREGQLFYRMVLALPSSITPFRLRRKLDKWVPRSKYEPSRSIEKVEVVGDFESVCIRVDNERQLYVTRDFIVTHNSLMSLTAFAADVKQGYSSKALVVCTTSLKYNWAAEVEKFTGFSYVVLDGSLQKRLIQFAKFREIQGPKVLIVNYEQVSGHLDRINSELFDLAIFDEAHMVKNPSAERTKACRKIFSRRSFMVTGTPIQHNVSDLWVLLDRVSPGAFRSFHHFKNRFCSFGGFGGKQIVGVKNEKELNEQLQQVMIRRMKADVLDLPEVQYIDRIVRLGASQQSLYDAIYKEFRVAFGDGTVKEDVANAAVRFLRCRQVCGTTATVAEDKYGDESTKLELAVNDALEMVDNGNHVVVFSQFRKVQECFSRRLRTARPSVPVYELNGDTDPRDRVAMVEKWTAEPVAVIVCSYAVAGVGLNMTKARYGLLLDKVPSPAMVQQAVDRMHRIGASVEHPVQILQYLANGTVEHRVEQILSSKRALTASVVDADISEASLMRAVIEADRKMEEMRNGQN
jgi:superfamily II DNA or RNA helicase